ncbi:hypothetical protein [Laspinema palackyanum]
MSSKPANFVLGFNSGFNGSDPVENPGKIEGDRLFYLLDLLQKKD